MTVVLAGSSPSTGAGASQPHRTCLGLAACLALAWATAAQGSDLRFERLSLKQGLSQSTVNAVVQDHDGFLWLGTQDGLNRYDGHDFVVYRSDPEDPASLSNNVIRTLLVARDGTLWIGTDGGLNAFDRATGQFTRYRHDPKDPQSLGHDFVWVLCESRDGDLWIGTDGGGLHRLDRASGRFTHYRHAPDAPLSLGNDEIRALLEDSTGALWVGTEGGLDRLDRQTGQFTHFRHRATEPHSLGHDAIRALIEDRSGQLWVGTDGGGLDRFDRQTETFHPFRHDPDHPDSLSHDEIRILFEDTSGALWVGTDAGGLNRLDPATGGFETFHHRSTDASSLSSNFIRSIFEDRSQVLWVGTDGGGLNKLDRQKNAFAHYRHDPSDEDSLGHSLVFAILQDRTEALWIGTWGGLHRLDRATGTMTRYLHDPDNPNSLANDEIWPLHEDRDGNLWIGTFGGLDRLDPTRQTFTHYRHDPERPDSLSHDYVRSIHEDAAGTLWVGTDGGLNRLVRRDRREGHFTVFRHDPADPASLSHNDVRVIHGGRDGLLWLGTAGGGVNAFAPERQNFTHYRQRPDQPGSLSHDFVRSIYEDRKGHVWVGTDDGLNRLDLARDRFTVFRTADGLPNNVIYGILEDDDGFLWLSTNGGLSRLDPRSETFDNYDVSDGLQNNEFNTGAYYKSPQGELFFGGINGLNAFFPQAVVDNPHPPPVVLTAFEKFNQAVDLPQPIQATEVLELSYRDSFFSFEFAALDYRSPAKNRYAYKLEGFDDRWIESGTQHQATYTNLDPGSYVFRVRGANNDGLWNEEGASIRLTIEPPFWGTWWFRSTILAVLAMALLGAHRALLARSRRQQQAIAERLRATEREGLIRELEAKNEELERFTFSVSHDLKAPLLTIQGFLGYLRRDAAAGDHERLERDLDRITTAATKMQHLVEELLELSLIGRQANHSEEIDLADLVAEARDLVDGEMADRGVTIRIAPDLPRVTADRARLLTVLQNLLQNAVKYMGDQASPEIDIGVRRQPGETVVFVRDNGQGIAPEYREKVFELFQRLDPDTKGTGVGLTLAKRILEAHGGRIWVESEGLGQGSTFCFTLPD